MMHEREKSDLAVVAVKLANKAERSAAELVERRGPKGMRVSIARTGLSTGQACHRRWSAYGMFAVKHPRWEKLWGGRRRSWHLYRPHEQMEVAPWPKSMISAEA